MEEADCSRASARESVAFALAEDPTPVLERRSTAALITTGVLVLVAVAIVGLTAVGIVAAEKASSAPAPRPPRLPCDHPVYCSGPLLAAVQTLGVFPDDKTFVDMPLRSPPAAVLALFAKVNHSDVAVVRAFVAQHFYPAGAEVVNATLPDFPAAPPFAANVTSPVLRRFAGDVHAVWPTLAKAFDTAAFCDECTSSLQTPHPFVVPGGRFREFYYWDSYWILRGLLRSGMHTTAWRLVANMLDFVKRYGFVPNGARRYYLDRSQPPLLALMVEAYVEVTGNTTLLDDALPLLLEEHRYWQGPRYTRAATAGAASALRSRYNVPVTSPRPESYRGDAALAAAAGAAADTVLTAVAAAAESGWDFSSRWFLRPARPGTAEPAQGAPDMQRIATPRVAPVDLNAILARGARLLAGWADARGRKDDAARLTAEAEGREAAIAAAYDGGVCEFRDVDFDTGARFGPWYGSHTAPVALAADLASLPSNSTGSCAVAALRRHVKAAGIPASEQHTGQQWDLPNAWAPVQWFAEVALRRIDTAEAEALRRDLVRGVVHAAYCGYGRDGVLFEKYNATAASGRTGRGGEYTPQSGFGWTNGVLLEMLARDGHWLPDPAAC